MLPFATPFSYRGNELVGAFVFRPEVAHQVVEIAYRRDTLLRCKALQIRCALKEYGSLLFSFLGAQHRGRALRCRRS